jgi:ATP-dependent helicase/nuclease subunit B
LELACRARGGDRTPAALAALRAMGKQAPQQTMQRRRGPLSSRDTIHGLYGERVRLTASRMDTFSRCRFSYFLRYGLRAQERRRADFDAPESGTFLHYVLEHVLKEVLGPNGEWRGVSRETVRTSAETWTKKYVETYLGGMESHSERFRYLFRRLTRMLYQILDNLMDELACSSFRPLDFELSFSERGDLPAIVMEDEYGQLELVGKVDRVDGYIKDNCLYIRVMDYKSGTKKFELSDLWYGLNMQLLIYLFAIKDNAAERYRKKLATQFDAIQTAGALYVPAKESVVSAPRGTDEKTLHTMREKLLCRSGLLLDDVDILNAMEQGITGNGRFLPIGVKKNGEWTSATKNSLASMAQMGKLYRHIQKTLKMMGHELLSGSIDAEPIVQGKQNTACSWCPYAAVCQYDETLGDHGRAAYQQPAEMVWEAMDQSEKEER